MIQFFVIKMKKNEKCEGDERSNKEKLNLSTFLPCLFFTLDKIEHLFY